MNKQAIGRKKLGEGVAAAVLILETTLAPGSAWAAEAGPQPSGTDPVIAEPWEKAKVSLVNVAPDGVILKPSTELLSFSKKMIDTGLIKEFALDQQNHLELKHPIDTLQKRYNLTPEESNIVSKMITTNKNTLSPVGVQKGDVRPEVFVSNWKVYFTYDDVNALLFAAASIGPAALAAELELIGTMMGGVVGTTIATILNILGAASLINLAYLIVQAEYRHQGIYIGIAWNGPFPNITQGTW